MRLKLALTELQAECIAVPPFDQSFLDMGLAIHFRCQHPEARNQDIDIMSKMRGVAPFDELWSRRTTLELDGENLEILSLPDLVRAKKNQRDKDWPMITRMMEAHYFEHKNSPSEAQVRFWLREMRTPQLLMSVATEFSDLAIMLAVERPLLSTACDGDEYELQTALRAEEELEKAADRDYWLPLKQELGRLRSEARRKS